MYRVVWKTVIIVALLSILSVAIVGQSTPPTQILVNSKDWQDVYSGIQYAKMKRLPGNFLVSERHALIYLESLNRDTRNIILMESDATYHSGFGSALRDLGFQVQTIEEDNNNLELAQRLVDEDGISSFILLDDTYGYNAISAAPYAVLTDSFVLFVNDGNVNDVVNFLQGVNGVEVATVGHLNRNIQAAIEQFSPRSLAEGSRYEVNVAMVRRFRAISDIQQIIITNGEFIEDEVMTGVEPVLFIGKNNIPEISKQYVRGSDIAVAVLIGNDLVQTGTIVKREMGITTFIKFARTARIPRDTLNQIEGLDLFYLPQYETRLDVERMQYNELSNTLEVTYANIGDIPLYFRSSLTVRDGELETTLGDEDSIFMDSDEVRTVTYDYTSVGSSLSVDALVLYGESETSLEKALQKTLEVGFVRILDTTELEILGLEYSKRNKAFGISVRNPGSEDVYASGELVDLLVDLEEVTVGSRRTLLVRAGEEQVLFVRQEMTDLDLADNPEVLTRVYFGQREEALIKSTEDTFPLEVQGFEYTTEIIAAAALILLFLLIWRRKKKKKRHK